MTRATDLKVGEVVMRADGRRAVCIGVAGTVNRGTMPARAVDRALGCDRVGDTFSGWHLQDLTTGHLSTLDRRELRAVAVVGHHLDELVLELAG